MPRIGIIGLGMMGRTHYEAYQEIPGAQVVAVCDREPDLAHQAAVRFDVPAEYDDFGHMLRHTTPDVVHIATPPASHRELLLRSVDAGAHVYVEKPFALTPSETDEMLAAADARGRLVCVGHDKLFDPVWLDVRRRIAAGEIGDVAHVDVIQLYDLSGPFGRLLLSDPSHWVRHLPAGLFHNTLPHALASVAELIADNEPAVTANSWARDGAGVDTEVQLLVRGQRVTAGVTFLTSVGPPGTWTRIHGTRGWLEADYEARTIQCRSAAGLPSLLVKLAVPMQRSREMARAAFRNLRRFAHADLHYFAGMQSLLRAFYLAIIEGQPSPLDASHVRRVAFMMDQIVARRRVEHVAVPSPVISALQV